MYLRTIHHQLSQSSLCYQIATAPVVLAGRAASLVLPEWMCTMADRIAYAFEMVLPKIAIIAAAAAVAYVSGNPSVAAAAFGSVIWFSFDAADALQFYPYDFLEDLSAPEYEKERSSTVLREDLIERMMFYLSKPTNNNNNVLVIGPAGSGKTAAAFALSDYLQSNKCPEEYKGKKIFRVRLDKLMANTQRPGDFEMRFLALLNILMIEKGTILFFDEVHQLMDRRGNGNTSLANLLKPFLTLGLRCLGATTIKEYRKHIQEDEGFDQRFNLVEMPPLSPQQCREILKKKFPGLSDSAANMAMRQAKDLYPHKALPRSAVVLLENAQHRTKTLPTSSAIAAQVLFEKRSVGTLQQT